VRHFATITATEDGEEQTAKTAKIAAYIRTSRSKMTRQNVLKDR
jgi:hypothetical protein